MKRTKRGRPPKHELPQIYPEMSEKEYEEISAGIDKLKGKEIIGMFNNEKDFLELCHRGQHFPKILDRFCWRLQYIIGQIFFYIQNTLHELQYLESAYMLNVNDIRKLACCLIEKAKQPSRDKEFTGLRGHFEKIFKKDRIGEYSMVRLYGICLKMWKHPLTIDVNLSYQTMQDMQKPIAKHKEAPVKIQDLSFQVKISQQAREMMADVPVKLPINLPQVIAQDDIIHLDNPSIPIKRQPGKCYNRNWSLQVQASLCRLYAQHQHSQQVKEELQKIYGKDPRWSSANQIDSKMQAIVAKVFKKIGGLQTTNPNIIKFRTLRSFILSSDQIGLEARRTLFKSIAIIYEAMIDVKDPAKKQTISQKILQILQLCKHYEVPPS